MTTTFPDDVELSGDVPDDLTPVQWKALPGGETSSPLTGVIDHNDADGTITALVAVTGVVDSVGDVIVPGSADAAVKRLKPKGVMSHNWGEKVSKLVWHKELMPGDPMLPKETPQGQPWPSNAGGLLIKAKYNLDKQSGRDAYADAKFYGPDECFSIGYKVRPGGARMRNGKRYLHDYDLYEWSQVLHGAHPLATLTGVKSLADTVESPWYDGTRSGDIEGGTVLPAGVELKVRVVRNADFWHLPVGTPIKPGLIPHGLNRPPTEQELHATTAEAGDDAGVHGAPDGIATPGVPAPPMPDMALPIPGPKDGDAPTGDAEKAVEALRKRVGEIQKVNTPAARTASAALTPFLVPGAPVRASEDGQLVAVHTGDAWRVADTANGGVMQLALPGTLPQPNVDVVLHELSGAGIPWDSVAARRQRWADNPAQLQADRAVVQGIFARAGTSQTTTPPGIGGAGQAALPLPPKPGALGAPNTPAGAPLGAPGVPPPATGPVTVQTANPNPSRYALPTTPPVVPPQTAPAVAAPPAGAPSVPTAPAVVPPPAGAPPVSPKTFPRGSLKGHGVAPGDRIRVHGHPRGTLEGTVESGKTGHHLVHDDGTKTWIGGSGSRHHVEKLGKAADQPPKPAPEPVKSEPVKSEPVKSEPAKPTAPEPYKPTGNINAPHKLTDEQLATEAAHATARYARARANGAPKTSVEHHDSKLANTVFADEIRRRAIGGESGVPAEPKTEPAPEIPASAATAPEKPPATPDEVIARARTQAASGQRGTAERAQALLRAIDPAQGGSSSNLDMSFIKTGMMAVKTGKDWDLLHAGTGLSVGVATAMAKRVSNAARLSSKDRVRKFVRAFDTGLRDANGDLPPLTTVEHPGEKLKDWKTGDGLGFQDALNHKVIPEYLDSIGMPEAKKKIDLLGRPIDWSRPGAASQHGNPPAGETLTPPDETGEVPEGKPDSAVPLPQEAVDSADRIRAEALGIIDGPDGQEELTPEAADRQDRVEGYLVAGETALTDQSDAQLGETRKDLTDELALQNELARRDTQRKREAATAAKAAGAQPDREDAPAASEDTGPKLRPGVAGAAEDLGDALNAKPRDDETVKAAADRFAKMLRRHGDSSAFDAVRAAIGDDITAAIASGDLKAGMLFTAAGSVREERRLARNEGAKKRRLAKRIDRDRIKALIGSVDTELRSRKDRKSGAAAVPTGAPVSSTAAPTTPPPGTRARANIINAAARDAGGYGGSGNRRVGDATVHSTFADDHATADAVIAAVRGIGWPGVTARDTNDNSVRRHIEVRVPDASEASTAAHSSRAAASSRLDPADLKPGDRFELDRPAMQRGKKITSTIEVLGHARHKGMDYLETHSSTQGVGNVSHDHFREGLADGSVRMLPSARRESKPADPRAAAEQAIRDGDRIALVDALKAMGATGPRETAMRLLEADPDDAVRDLDDIKPALSTSARKPEAPPELGKTLTEMSLEELRDERRGLLNNHRTPAETARLREIRDEMTQREDAAWQAEIAAGTTERAHQKLRKATTHREIDDVVASTPDDALLGVADRMKGHQNPRADRVHAEVARRGIGQGAQSPTTEGGDRERPSSPDRSVVPGVPAEGVRRDQGQTGVLSGTDRPGDRADRTTDRRDSGPGPAGGDLRPQTGAPQRSASSGDGEGDAGVRDVPAPAELEGQRGAEPGDTGPEHAPPGEPGGSAIPDGDGGLRDGEQRTGRPAPDSAPEDATGPAVPDEDTGAPGERPGAADEAVTAEDQPDADAGQVDAIPDTGESFRPTGDALAPAGKKAKLEANLAALRVLRALQAEKRSATPEEQTVLSRWAGWGGLPDVFDKRKTDYAKERAELRGLLSPAEWNEGRRNTLNAHYTDPRVVQAVWQAVDNLGFDGGRVLEPGSGSGTFIGFAPPDADMVGVELDSTTAAISRALYPHATIRNESFAKTRLPAGSFDATVGNVPFGQFELLDKVHNPGKKMSIHNHFIVKSLAMTKPGGVVALLTSRYTLDAKSPRDRKRMAEMGDLIGAVRLPTGSHSKTSGTDVIEDILIFRRREPGAAPLTSQDWINSSERDIDGHPITVNDYFDAHPDNVLGELHAEKGQYGTGSLIVRGDKDAAGLPAALARITDAAKADGITATPRMHDLHALVDADTSRHEGHIAAADDGGFTQATGGVATPFEVPEKQAEELRGLIGMRDTLSSLLTAESRSVSNSPEIKGLRADLNTQYDAYVARYGPINRYTLTKTGARNAPGQGGFRRDPMSAIVRALEIYNPETGKAVKTDIFTKRATSPREIPTHADNPADALALSLDTYGEVNLDEIAKMLGVSTEAARHQLGDLVFEQPPLTDAEHERAWDAREGDGDGLDGEPTAERVDLSSVGESVRAEGKLEPAAAYLSGNVRRKLAAAQAAAAHDERFAPNVAALKKVIPTDLGVDEIDGRLGAAWIPADDVKQFMIDLLYDGDSRYDPVKVATSGGGIWTVVGGDHGNKATEQWGTRRKSAGELIAAMLEQKPIRVNDSIDGKTYQNLEETLAAQAKADELQERFSEWLFEDSDRTKRLLRSYNDQFNAIRLRNYDDMARVFPGMADNFVPRDHQVGAVNRIVSEPSALLGHVVGAGKAQPMDAQILTPSGFRRMGDLMVGDAVISVDGSPTTVTAVYPQGPKDNYRVTFLDGGTAECNDEHLWCVQSKDWADKGISAKVLTLAEICQRGLLDSRGRPRWRSPVASAAHFDCGLPRPLDPYLLGVLIGDGSLANASAVRFTSADSEIVAAVEAAIPAGYVVKHSEGVRPYDYRITPVVRLTRGQNTLVRDLEDLSLMGRTARSKQVPRAYLEAPVAVRLAVLQGLMDTDGTQPNKPGHNPVFTTISRQLADDVIWLTRSLGGTARQRSKTPPGGSVAYDVTVNLPAGYAPFQLSRKAENYQPTTKYVPVRTIAAVERIGVKPMQCIAVDHPTHLYVTSDFLVTHNTAEMAMGAAELKRLGMAKKPAIIVPSHMLEQFTREYLQIYPNAKILAAGTDDLTGDRRREFVARAATGQWDCVILTKDAMQLIPMSPEATSAYIDREMATMREQLEAAQAGGGGDSAQQTTLKKMEKAVIAAEEALRAKLEKTKDAGVSFEQTGIDYLFADEAHMYSNLRTPSNIQGGGATGSGIATDLHMKIEHLRANNASGRVVTFATGTPIRNTVTQAYIMQRFMRPDLLKEAGINSFDQWAATFGQTVDEMELKPEGTGFRQTTRFAKFRNVPELLRLFQIFADIKTAEDLNLPTPKLEGGEVDNVVVPSTDELKEMMAELATRADHYRAGSPDKRPNAAGDGEVDDMMLLISMDGRKAAMQLSNKLDIAADKMAEIYQRTKDKPVPKDLDDPTAGDDPPPGGLQIVFCDMFTPKGGTKTETELRSEFGPGSDFDAYEALRQKLADRGMDPKTIRFMHEAKNDRQKAELFAAARNGQISVLIGSTEKMGVGTNVQRRAVALHHLDAPWRPSDLEQRDGRIMRQGNANDTISIHRYVTEGSFDGYMWQTLERKKKFIDQIMRGTLDQREIEDVGDTALSYAEVKALATGNPLLLQKATADTAIGKLSRLERTHNRTQTNLRRDVESNRLNAAASEAHVTAMNAAIAQRTDTTTGDNFALTVHGTTTHDRSEAVAMLKASIEDVIRNDYGYGKKSKPVATFGGHKLMAEVDTYYDKAGVRRQGVALTWDGVPDHKAGAFTPAQITTMGQGTLIGLHNSLHSFEHRRDRNQARADTLRDEADVMEKRIGTPFPHAEALKTARAESERLTAAMTAAGMTDTGAPGESEGAQALATARTKAAAQAARMGRSGGGAAANLKRFGNSTASPGAVASPDGAIGAFGKGDELHVFLTDDGVDLRDIAGITSTNMPGVIDNAQALVDDLEKLDLPFGEGAHALYRRWNDYAYVAPDYTKSYEEREKIAQAKRDKVKAVEVGDKTAIRAVFARHTVADTSPAKTGVELAKINSAKASGNTRIGDAAKKRLQRFAKASKRIEHYASDDGTIAAVADTNGHLEYFATGNGMLLNDHSLERPIADPQAVVDGLAALHIPLGDQEARYERWGKGDGQQQADLAAVKEVYRRHMAPEEKAVISAMDLARAQRVGIEVKLRAATPPKPDLPDDSDIEPFTEIVADDVRYVMDASGVLQRLDECPGCGAQMMIPAYGGSAAPPCPACGVVPDGIDSRRAPVG